MFTRGEDVEDSQLAHPLRVIERHAIGDTPAAIMSRPSATVPPWMSWSGLVYYGETLGFVLAWIAGIAALTYTTAPSPAVPEVSHVAAAGGASVSADRQ